MVYCGKPSRGCQMCRSRRIKCDETKPTCTQCQKSRRVCPGYKDDFDLVFRNETKATERRARRTPHSKRQQSQVITFQTGESSTKPTEDASASKDVVMSGTTENLMDLVQQQTLSVPIEEQAPCYFVSNYVKSTDSASSKGHFDFLLPMMQNEPKDSTLSIAFSAVAMASLANRPNTRNKKLYHEAVFRYSKALKATNLALQDPALQKTDETLASVLMLGFYETVMNDRTNASAWQSHIDGASEIVRMRGKKQLRTKVGQSLFMCVRAQMTIHCITASKAPMNGMEWWFVDGASHDFGIFVANLGLRVAELRAEINHSLATFPRTPEYVQKVSQLARRAQALEQEYQEIVDHLTEDWLPKTVAWVDQVPGGDISKAEVCPGRVDMYKDIWVAWTWNNARIARMYISGAALRCAAWINFPMDYRTTPEYATAHKLCADLTTDIIAGVPYHLGWRVEKSGALKPDFEGFSFSDGNFSNPKALGGFFSMYPLLSVMCTDYVTDSQRAWARGRLHHISDIIGLSHARVIAGFQLRLPSMIIRRDMLVHSSMSAATLLQAAAARQSQSPFPTLSPPVASPPSSANYTTSPPPVGSSGGSPSAAIGGSPPGGYTMSPLQQRDMMQREQREKERRALLQKATNSQGQSVEKLMATYLAV